MITTSAKMELKLEGEKGDYLLFLPVGSSLEEAVRMTATFTQALNLSLEEHKKTEKEKETDVTTEQSTVE